jgi:hypothetical protein
MGATQARAPATPSDFVGDVPCFDIELSVFGADPGGPAPAICGTCELSQLPPWGALMIM